MAWKSQEAKKNLEILIQYEKETGFEMLRNEYHFTEKNRDKLYIFGAENWGLKPFS